MVSQSNLFTQLSEFAIDERPVGWRLNEEYLKCNRLNVGYRPVSKLVNTAETGDSLAQPSVSSTAPRLCSSWTQRDLC